MKPNWTEQIAEHFYQHRDLELLYQTFPFSKSTIDGHLARSQVRKQIRQERDAEIIRYGQQFRTYWEVADQTGVSAGTVAKILKEVGIELSWATETEVAAQREALEREVLDFVPYFKTYKDLANHLNMSETDVRYILKKHGVTYERPKKKESIARKERLLRQYNAGATLQELADQEGVTRQRIRQLLATDERYSGRTADSKYAHVNVEEVVKLAADGYSGKEIAEHFGAPTYYIYNIMKTHAIQTVSVKERYPKETIERMIDEGMTRREIAEYMGITLPSLYHIVVQYGLVGKDNKVRLDLSDEELQELLYQYSMQEIADMYNVTYTCVCNRAKNLEKVDRRFSQYDREMHEALIADYERGVPVRELAKHYRMGTSRVYRLIRDWYQES